MSKVSTLSLYHKLIGPIREEAERLGYAVAVHGSLARDIDLVACPWTPEAVSSQELAVALKVIIEKHNDGIAGQIEGIESWDRPYFAQGCPTAKPHGRRGWIYYLLSPIVPGATPYIDLSVMPRLEGIWEPIIDVETGEKLT